MTGGHFHAEVAARDHAAVGLAHDVADVVERARRLDLGDDRDALAAVVGKEPLDLAHARPVTDKRCGDHIDSLLNAEQQIGAVLIGHCRKRKLRAGNVDRLALAEHAVVCDHVFDIVAVKARDRELDQAIVQKKALPEREASRQRGAALKHAPVAAVGGLIGSEYEGLACGKSDRLASCEQAGADLGAFGVQHDGAGDARFGAQALHPLDTARMLLVAAVAEVQARDVHPCIEQGTQLLLAVDRRPQRADYLGPACHTPPLHALAF